MNLLEQIEGEFVLYMFNATVLSTGEHIDQTEIIDNITTYDLLTDGGSDLCKTEVFYSFQDSITADKFLSMKVGNRHWFRTNRDVESEGMSCLIRVS